MTITDIITYVNNNYRKKSGNLYPNLNKRERWKNTDVFDCIYNLTKFLPDDTPFPQRYWHIINNLLELKTCLNCDKLVKWNNNSTYREFCSNKCASESLIPREKFKNTCMEKYGEISPMRVEKIKDKLKAKLLNKYGVDSYSKTDEFKEKFKSKCLEKYGVDNPAKNESSKEKIKTTCLEKYGHEYAIQNKYVMEKRNITNQSKFGGNSPMHCESVKEAHRQSIFEKYGVDNNKHLLLSVHAKETLDNVPLLEEFLKTKSATEIARDLDVDTTTVINYLKKHDIHDQLHRHAMSYVERQLAEFLTEYNIKFEQNNRKIIPPQELDIYIPEHNLAIELCGVYWHSESKGKDRNYHYNKWKKCKDIGITLLTYFDDEVENSWEIIKSKILYMTKNLNSTKIGARQVAIKTPTNTEETEFLNNNHIQGSLKSRTYKTGAYYNDKLIGILCATQRKDYLEITRYATDINYNCSGLFSKLLKHMIKELNFSGTIVSFSDNCHSNGNLYKMSNFSIDKVLESGYTYTLNGRPRENRQQYMKSKIAKKFNISIDDKTEWELMQSLGYDRVWDCGKTKWIKTI